MPKLAGPDIDGRRTDYGFTFLNTDAIHYGFATDAHARLRPIHDRMPVGLDPADWGPWIEGPAEAVQHLLRPAPDAALVAYPVSARVGNVRNDDPDLLVEVPAPLV